VLDSRNSRLRAVRTGDGSDSSGNLERESGPDDIGDRRGNDRHSGVVAYPQSRTYRLYARAYSATAAFGFAVFGIIELFRR
jgi:hypothetical protein